MRSKFITRGGNKLKLCWLQIKALLLMMTALPLGWPVCPMPGSTQHESGLDTQAVVLSQSVQQKSVQQKSHNLPVSQLIGERDMRIKIRSLSGSTKPTGHVAAAALLAVGRRPSAPKALGTHKGDGARATCSPPLAVPHEARCWPYLAVSHGVVSGELTLSRSTAIEPPSSHDRSFCGERL